MAIKALTHIIHNGEEFEPGDALPKNKFTKEQMQTLLASGSVGEEAAMAASEPEPEVPSEGDS